MADDVDEREDRREGRGDRRTTHFEFTFDHFKWIISLAVALIGIYVVSERRAATSDLTAAYLDRKVDEINKRQDERFTAIQNSIQVVQGDVKGLALANSSIQGDMKAFEGRMTKAENAISTQERAYNFNFTTRLAAVEARLGIKPTGSTPREE